MPLNSAAGKTERTPLSASSTPRDEPRIIEAVLAGETHLYHELIRPYESTVYRMALTLVKHEADAEDVAQEAFLLAFRKLSTFRYESRFSTWLISITLNAARSRLHQRGAQATDSLDATPEERGHVAPALLRDWREIPSQALERNELRYMLQQAIATLPMLYREVFVMRDVQQRSIEETATILTLTPGTVKVRLHRARIMLQKRLSPQLQHFAPTRRRWFPW